MAPRDRRFWTGWALLIAIAVALGLWAIGSMRRASASLARSGVEIATARRDLLAQTLLVSGELVAVRAVRVAVPRFRERGAVPIQEMAPDGSLVKPGDVLLQFDNANLNARLNADRLALDKAENDLVRTSSEEQARIKDLEIEQAELRLDLDKAALKAELPRDLLPLREWQDYQFAHQRAKQMYERSMQALALARDAAGQDVARLQITRDQLRARIALAQRDLEALRVVATSAGTVVYEHAPLTWNSGDQARKFQLGDQVWPGTVIMTVADLSDLEVRIYVSEVDGGLVAAGMRARVTPESGKRVPVEGRLTSIREVAERQRHLSNVRVFVGTVALDQTAHSEMKPGMSARVELLLSEHGGLILPRSAIALEGRRAFVRRRSGERQEVTVVARNATECLVDGLNDGDVVLLNR